MIRPLCAREGCTKPVKERKCKYCSIACIPSSVRANALRKARASYARKQRAKKFGQSWVRFQASDRSQMDFFAVCQDIAELFWARGYTACEHKWARVKARRVA